MALAILAGSIVLVWNFIVEPMLDLAFSRQSDVTILSEQLKQLRTVETQAPAFSQRERQALRQLTTLGVFWSGPNEAAITAQMQDLIRNAAQQSGGIVTSSSALPKSETPLHLMLAVRARIEGSLDTLQQVLATADGANPKLFVENLDISSGDPGSESHPPQVNFEISLSGYVAAVPNAN